TANENVGTITVEALPGTDIRKLLDDIKSRVDAIDTFPEETEKPIIQEVLNRRQVINVAISGNTDEYSLKNIGERARNEILQLPGITQVELTIARPYEISIEVSEHALRRYGLTFDEVVMAVRRSSLDLPGGSIKTDGGEILLRTKGQAYKGPEFEKLILRTNKDGSRVMVGHVATVVDGFAETDQSARFDGKPAVMVQVFRVGDEDAIEVADAVKNYVSLVRTKLPEGIELTIWQDYSRILRDRLKLLIRNGLMGLILVFITLALFLRFRLAFWVALGIPISFCGALWLIPTFDVSINMITLFAFIVVIGIVVDDAIIVGENIYSNFEKGKSKLRAAVDGVSEVSIPVTFAVLTSIAAFAPLLFVEGVMGKVFRFIPIIIISTLAFSLIESLFILPTHLSHLIHDDKKKPDGRWRRFQDKFDRRLKWFIKGVYRPGLEWGLKMRYTTIAIGIAVLALTIGLVRGEWIKFTFMPKVDADNVMAILTMPLGTPASLTTEVIKQIDEVALQLDSEFRDRNDGQPVIQHVLSSIGEQPSRNQGHGPMAGDGSYSASHLGEVNIELIPGEKRSVGSTEIAQRWRQLVGAIPGVDELTFSSSMFTAGEATNVQFASDDYEALQSVANELKAKLADYPGVSDITDSYQAGKQEIKLDITPAAEALGLTLSDLGRQVRQAFYGAEAQRIQRGRNDIRVMVRYPEQERRSIADLEDMRIRVPGGGEVPFSVAARADLGQGYASIRRTDRQRTINVTADVDEKRTNANAIMADVTKNVLPQILREYPGVTYSLEGVQREQMESMRSLARGFIFALLVIFVLLAIPFRSYVQPFIVMSAIPFGIVGAVWGHVIMGMELSILSMMGIVALAGVVVNDSLVMVDYINRFRAGGRTIIEAIKTAGAARFRPILLTSITTFAGLTPLMLERSLQARFMIPMAISLAFGVIFATVISLILVPVSYLILEDIKHAFAKLFGIVKETESPVGIKQSA
ncbi:MAG: efflux RND transporter permease subunit, partial [Planctomycetes bacterium]|nr:efflux RND transporter permease subunit [Planctomycetota bacterium]